MVFSDNSLREFLNFRGDVVRHFLDRGAEVVIVAPRNVEDNELLRRCKVYDVELERSGMNPLADLRYMRRLIVIYLRERPDHAFHYTIKPNVYGSIAAWLARVPRTAMVTGLGYSFNHNDLRGRMARWLYRLGLLFSQRVLVLNADNRRVLIERHIVDGRKIILLEGGEGIDTSRYI